MVGFGLLSEEFDLVVFMGDVLGGWICAGYHGLIPDLVPLLF